MKKNFRFLSAVLAACMSLTMFAGAVNTSADGNSADLGFSLKTPDEDMVIVSQKEETIEDGIVLEKTVEVNAIDLYNAGYKRNISVTHRYYDSKTDDTISTIRLAGTFHYSDVANPAYCEFVGTPTVAYHNYFEEDGVGIRRNDNQMEIENDATTSLTASHYARCEIDYRFKGYIDREVTRSMWIKCTESGKTSTSNDKDF